MGHDIYAFVNRLAAKGLIDRGNADQAFTIENGKVFDVLSPAGRADLRRYATREPVAPRSSITPGGSLIIGAKTLAGVGIGLFVVIGGAIVITMFVWRTEPRRNKAVEEEAEAEEDD